MRKHQFTSERISGMRNAQDAGKGTPILFRQRRQQRTALLSVEAGLQWLTIPDENARLTRLVADQTLTKFL